MTGARVKPLHRIKRWMYAGNRPNRLSRALNALSAWQYAHGILTLGGRGVTLEVRGRVSGRLVRLPLVLVHMDGNRYLVSMLGTDAQWVRNLYAADGHAILHSPRPEQVRLVDVPVDERAPVLKRYLALAPGARPHVPVDRRAPLARFTPIAPEFPVFRVDSA
ncbi:nitroreductase/quinone reductase family protein [Cellulomonas sp. 179-A 4D5 NHS]|uniref:nitroreductase/quinone reductase family protein n=1 Tax=Cellulomonas sp. 179-A 4D5 NHS TaxID=3142378 RepID=UPI0039A2941B